MIIDTDKISDSSEIKHIWFPGGEAHIDLPELNSKIVHVHARVRNAGDVIKLTALLSAINYRGGTAFLFMPYLPGARQDRVQAGFAFTCEMYAAIFGCFVEHITCVDPHSEKALNSYNEFVDTTSIPLKNFIQALIPSHRYDMVLAPDKGAVDRAMAVAAALSVEQLQFCTKERDAATGKLAGFSVPKMDFNTPFPKILIVDDICDGGGTFIGITEEIRKQYPSAEIDLYVTHGIFSKGFNVLFEYIRNIYTTDSFYEGLSVSVGDGYNTIAVLNLIDYYLENLTP